MPDTYTSQFSGEEIDSALRAAQIISGADTPAELRKKLEIRGDTIPVSATDPTPVSEALTASGGGVNPNLLDNWFFGRAVNQRGITEPADIRYAIDRWKINYVTQMQVLDGYIRITGQNDVSQMFDADFRKSLVGKKVTCSILYKNTSGHITSSAGVLENASDEWDLISKTVTWTDSDETFHLFRGGNPNSSSCDILAAKLELGSTQTLAHKEGDRWMLNEIPDFGEQLRRCQRYCRVIGGTMNQPFCNAVRREATKLEGFIPIDNSFRTAPSISVNGYFSVIPDFHSVKFTSGDTLSPQGVTLFFERNDGGTFDKDAYLIYAGADTRITLSADL